MNPGEESVAAEPPAAIQASFRLRRTGLARLSVLAGTVASRRHRRRYPRLTCPNRKSRGRASCMSPSRCGVSWWRLLYHCCM